MHIIIFHHIVRSRRGEIIPRREEENILIQAVELSREEEREIAESQSIINPHRRNAIHNQSQCRECVKR